MKNYLISLLILLIMCLPLAFANQQYTDWGGSGYSFSDFIFSPSGVWSSNSRDNTLPVSSANATIGMYRLPIIASLDKSLSLSKSNEIYMITQTGIQIYDSSFSNVGSSVLSGWNGTIAVVDYPLSSSLYLAYLSKTGTDWNLNIINRTGYGFSLYKSINVTDRDYTGSVKSGKRLVVGETPSYAYIWDKSYDITRIDLVSGTETFYPTFNSSMISCSKDYTTYYNNPVEVNDFTGDFIDDVLVIARDSSSTTSVIIGVLDTSSSSWITQKVLTSRVTTDGCSISSAKIGTSGTSPKIITFTKASSVSARIDVLDILGNSLFSDSSVYEYLYPSSADINRDGKNEFIYADDGGTSLLIYDDGFSLLKTIPVVPLSGSLRPNTNDMSMMNFGGFALDSFYQDMIVPKGIYQFNSSLTGGQFIYNFSYSASQTLMALPVSIATQDKADIFMVSESASPTIAYFTRPFFAVCGDGSCSATETALTCPDDCAPQNQEASVLTSVEINPCYTQVWLENTSVKVTAIAQNLNADNVNIYVQYASGFLSGCGQNASALNVKSGSINTFVFNANCTGQSEIVVSANNVKVTEFNTLSFPFEVSSSSGISYGDSSCGIIQPLGEVLINTNTTGTTDNAITGTANLFAEMTGLSATVIYIFMMFIVGIACFVFGLYKGMEGKMVFMIVMVLETLLLIIGTIPPISVIPIGVLIVLVLVFAVIIAMWLRSIFTGSGDGNQGVQ